MLIVPIAEPAAFSVQAPITGQLAAASVHARARFAQNLKRLLNNTVGDGKPDEDIAMFESVISRGKRLNDGNVRDTSARVEPSTKPASELRLL